MGRAREEGEVMIRLKYPNGNPRMKTMTVGELIARLNEYDTRMPVVFEWETTLNGIEPIDFGVEVIDNTGCLVVDVDR